MERGTEWEKKALKEAWDARAAQKKTVDTLLRGFCLVLGGLLLVGFGFMHPIEYCIATGAGARCTASQVNSDILLLITAVGGGAVGVGARTLWEAKKP